ncbi:IgGFc-binding protein-like [Parasteatoda tepidariorum]|uniref:IgGFc-binding protein-like n=1 Tax=Parasteatoda tepidariorum TaxID=114398 RepID=UPI00077FA6C6|nr:von Willebrand factor-like [Parasteatoda tepidariorum]
MAFITELLLLSGVLTAFYSIEPNADGGSEEPAVMEALGELVGKYENPKSLYDLIAHFPIDKKIVCPDSDARLPYPGDCTRYVTCRDFKAHIRVCPPGFKFDKEALHCRYGIQVNCHDPDNNKRACGENEKYSVCGPACEASCYNINNDYDDCPKRCVKGCFCQDGFIRGPNRICIKPNECMFSNMVEPRFIVNSHIIEKIPGDEFEI